MSAPEERTFGPYVLRVDGAHAIIERTDGAPAEPSWYELQTLKMAWGSFARAVEVFPAQDKVYDTRNKRHLWRVPDCVRVPCLWGPETWADRVGELP